MTWPHVLLVALAGGVALFVWNAICWMGLKHHNSDFRPMPKREGVERALTESGVTAGFYQLPHWLDFPGGFKDPALDARYKAGPNVFMVVSPPGQCMNGSTFLIGFLVNFLEALGVAVAFRYAAWSMDTLPRAVGFAAMLGVLVHGSAYLAQGVWMKYPWIHVMKTLLIDVLVGFALVGVVLHLLR